MFEKVQEDDGLSGWEEEEAWILVGFRIILGNGCNAALEFAVHGTPLSLSYPRMLSGSPRYEFRAGVLGFTPVFLVSFGRLGVVVGCRTGQTQLLRRGAE